MKRRRIILFIISFTFLIFNLSFAKVNIDSTSLNILERGAVTEFVGDVHITSDNFVITAERAVSSKESGVIKAYGNVYINYS